MSNKIQLQTNNTALDGYITHVNAAKNIVINLSEDGNENVEICSVNAVFEGTVVMIVYIDNEYSTHYLELERSGEFQLENVVKGTDVLFFTAAEGYYREFTCTNAELKSYGHNPFSEIITFTITGDATITENA